MGKTLHELEHHITTSIHQYERKRAYTFLALFSCIATTILSGMIYLVITLVRYLAESGFTSVVRLAWTDTDIITMYWKEFAMTLLEYLPITHVVSLLILSYLFLLSIYQIHNQMRTHLVSVSS